MASLALSDEELMVRDIAREFCAERSPVSKLRDLRDYPTPQGFDPAIWQEMTGLGWASVPWPEQHGGVGAGYRMLGVITEEVGRTLTASPLIATAWVGGTAMSKGGAPGWREELLGKIMQGDALVAFAHEEGAHHAPYKITTSVRETPEGFVVSGRKALVLDAASADYFIVVARSTGDSGARDGITLLLVPAGPDIHCKPLSLVDARSAAEVVLDEVLVSKAAVIGKVGQGADLLDEILDVARIGLAAEMLGSAQECFDRTITYLKERIQFGVPIGSFQALKHRAAMLYCDVELARSCVLAALDALDDPNLSAEIPVRASMAKGKVGQVFHDVACEAVQFHGGYGMTDECEIGFYLKRAAVTAQLFGDTGFHKKRFASLRHQKGLLASSRECVQ